MTQYTEHQSKQCEITIKETSGRRGTDLDLRRDTLFPCPLPVSVLFSPSSDPKLGVVKLKLYIVQCLIMFSVSFLLSLKTTFYTRKEPI